MCFISKAPLTGAGCRGWNRPGPPHLVQADAKTGLRGHYIVGICQIEPVDRPHAVVAPRVELDSSCAGVCQQVVVGVTRSAHQQQVGGCHRLALGILAVVAVAGRVQEYDPADLPVLARLFAEWRGGIDGVAQAHRRANVPAYGFGACPQDAAAEFIAQAGQGVAHHEGPQRRYGQGAENGQDGRGRHQLDQREAARARHEVCMGGMKVHVTNCLIGHNLLTLR